MTAAAPYAVLEVALAVLVVLVTIAGLTILALVQDTGDEA